MGYYINPKTETKEAWLSKNGVKSNMNEVQQCEIGEKVPVCLVDNGPFTAAAIAYDAGERDEFLKPDHRPKIWFLVDRELLKPFCSRL